MDNDDKRSISRSGKFQSLRFPADENLTIELHGKICNALDTQDHTCDSNKNRVCFDSDEEQCLSTDTCTGPTMTNCTCNTYYEFVLEKPEWIINNKETTAKTNVNICLAHWMPI